MALTPEQMRDFIADLERRGRTQVRHDLDHGGIAPAFVFIASNWLSEKEHEAERRSEASRSEQLETAKRASAAAERAAAAAEKAASEAARAATAAERQATAAERANKKATIALAIAIISMATTAIVTVIGITVTHWDARK